MIVFMLPFLVYNASIKMAEWLGRPVVGKVCIHYCVGDSQGNNRWLGHFNGSGNLNHPYQDCNCQMWDMDEPTASYQYITRQDYFSQIR